jgi:hypothetical protein
MGQRSNPMRNPVLESAHQSVWGANSDSAPKVDKVTARMIKFTSIVAVKHRHSVSIV